jgi:hypothetical protein
MLFTVETVKNEELNSINNFFANIEKEFEPVATCEDVEAPVESPVSKYLSSLVCGQYKKSVNDIENTKIGNKITRKRSVQQVMQESFFYGSNRFGNNFIA